MSNNNQTESSDRYLTIREACDILNCHPNTLRKWDKLGILTPMRFGTRGDRRYKKKDVLGFLEGTTQKEIIKREKQVRAPIAASIRSLQQTTRMLEKEFKQKGDEHSSIKISAMKKDIDTLTELITRLLNE